MASAAESRPPAEEMQNLVLDEATGERVTKNESTSNGLATISCSATISLKLLTREAT